jgi:predicted outer membrane repeat protein
MVNLLGRSRTIATAAFALLAAGASAAHAAKVVVTDCTSDTDLRAKLAQLQTKRGGKLKFACGAMPTIILSGGPLTISKKVKIDGGNGFTSFVTLSGGNNTTLFTVNSGAKATLHALVLTRGFNSGGDGGAISNFGKLTIDLCMLNENQAAASGGAILSYGKLTVRNSSFDSNKAANGAAIYPRFAAAQTTLERVRFSDNQTTSTVDGWGGAILIWDGASVVASDATFEDNTARNAGGAVYVFGATSTLTSLRTQWRGNKATLGKGGAVYNQGTFLANGEDFFEGNRALNGGAIYNELQLAVTQSTLKTNNADSDGGGIHNRGSMSVFESTLSENQGGSSGGRGGAIYNEGTVLLENVTLSGNYAPLGGGLMTGKAGAYVQLRNATVTNNETMSGGAGITYGAGTVRIANSIVGDNLGADCAATAGATAVIDSQGFNLSSDASCSFDQLTDLEGTDPQLDVLANNGGFSKTHMPLPDSDAIDNGGGVDCQPVDERLTERPQAAACDIGAVERCEPGKPSDFALLSPADGASLEVFGQLDWSDASCASKYLLNVRLGSSTGEVVIKNYKALTSHAALPFFAFRPGTYFWQVRACNGNKCRPSPWWAFVPVNLDVSAGIAASAAH